jgi:hypothetical protein
MAEDNKCAHEGCICQKMQDSDYCSAFCENAEASGVTTIQCECGHPGCS